MEGTTETQRTQKAQLFVGWVSGSVTHAGVGFHASTQPTFILYLIPPTHLLHKVEKSPFYVSSLFVNERCDQWMP